MSHRLKIRVDCGPGDHWECECRRWWFSSLECLSDEEVAAELARSYAAHIYSVAERTDRGDP